MHNDHHVILRVVSKTLIPIIALFAFYVQFHGEYSPGGGFQAGVILAVCIVLYTLIFGIEATMKLIPVKFVRRLSAFGVLLYAMVGIFALFGGGNFLDYSELFQEAPGGHWAEHVGIILIELGVLFGVAGAITTIFYGFAARVAEISDEDW